MTVKPTIVWRIVDGKPGHENQTQGLVESLRDYVPVQSIDIPCHSFSQAMICLLLKTFPLHSSKPDLIVGAGHKTHLSLLAAKRTWKCPVIVLMNPSLPRKLFDMCIIPEHDNINASADVLITDGVLNRIKPDSTRQPGSGLLLIGGPSKHMLWSDQQVVNQLEEIVNRSDVYFTIATSRRTPDSFVQEIARRNIPNMSLVLADNAGTGWLAEQLPQCEQVWITEDSVSMIYEALSAGASCGVLQTTNNPSHKQGRVLAGLEKLKREKLVTTFDDWLNGTALQPPHELLAESSRCAKIIVEKWLIKN